MKEKCADDGLFQMPSTNEQFQFVVTLMVPSDFDLFSMSILAQMACRINLLLYKLRDAVLRDSDLKVSGDILEQNRGNNIMEAAIFI